VSGRRSRDVVAVGDPGASVRRDGGADVTTTGTDGMRVCRLCARADVVRLPIEGVPADCTCRWNWQAGELVRLVVAGCVEHGKPTDIVIAWLLTPAFRDFAVGIATAGADPVRTLPTFCADSVQIAHGQSRAGKVWRALGRNWDSVSWPDVITALQDAGRIGE
jgi:hypothetical protein